MAASTVLPGGAPLANQNARVHGLYARYVPLADLQEALNVPLDDLQLEIALVRRSLAELVGAKLSPGEYVPLLRQAVGALSSLMKAQRALSGANDDDDIGAVLGEMGL